MDFKDLNGSFGSESERKTTVIKTNRRKRNTITSRGNCFSVKQWLKIVLYFLIVVIVIIFIANWECILSAVYYGFILPLLKFVATIAIVIAIIAAGVGYIRFKIYNWFGFK